MGEGSPQFFGRLVLFRCRFCERVRLAGRQDGSGATWQDESAVLQAQGFGQEDAWWFHTCCERCHSTMHASHSA